MKNIIFDFDGPLFDARQIAKYTLQEVFDELQLGIKVELEGVPLMSPNKFVKVCMDKHGIKKLDVQVLADIYYERLERNELSSDMREGIKEILEQLKKNGNRLFIISDRSEKRLKILLERFEIENVFEEVLGRERYGLKPSQGSVDYLKEVFGVIPESTWMIGDSENDYQYAKMAGYHYVHAAYSSEPSRVFFEKCSLVLEKEEELLLI